MSTAALAALAHGALTAAALVALVVSLAALLWIVSVRSASRIRLGSLPKPRDVSRWVVGPDGTVEASMPAEQSGYRVAQARGVSIWTWAPEGTDAHEVYTAAFDGIEGSYLSTYPDEDVSVVPQPDGSLYCESSGIPTAKPLRPTPAA